MPEKFNDVVEKLPEIKQEDFDLDKIVEEAMNTDRPIMYLLENNIVLDTKIAWRFLKLKKGGLVAKHLDQFEGLDQAIALKLIEVNLDYYVVENLDRFEGLDQQIVLKLIDAEQYYSLAKNLKKVKGLDHKETALNLINAEYSFCVVENLENFEGLDQVIALKLIEAGYGYPVAKNLEKFEGLNKDFIEKYILRILVNKKEYEKLGYIRNFYYSKLFLREFIKLINSDFSDFEMEKLYFVLAKKSDWEEYLGKEFINKFLAKLPKNKTRDEKRNAFTNNQYDRTSRFLKYLHENSLFTIDEFELIIAGNYIEKYALSKQFKLYDYFRNLELLNRGLIDELPAEQLSEGIFSFDILDEKYKKIQALVFSSEELLASDLEGVSNFEIELLDQITGKSSHSFYGNGKSMEETINDFKNHSNSKEYTPVPEGYQSINIETLSIEYEFDKEKLEDENSFYHILKTEILSVFDFENKDEELFATLSQNLKAKIEEKKLGLSKKKDIPYIQKQLEFYDGLLNDLEEIDGDYDKLLAIILKIDRKTIKKLDLESDLRKIIFRKVLGRRMSSGQNIEEILNLLSAKEASAEALLAVLNLIDNLIKDHILNLDDANEEGYWEEGTWQQIIKAKNDKKLANILKIFNPYIGELRKEVDNLKIVEIGETNIHIDCYPDRGLIGEMSGYLGNACYTAEYPLLAQYANVVPYKFIDKTDPDNLEFLGSVLVFELESKDGEKVALLRAFDIPREEKVNIPKFIEDFINKISPSLKARGLDKIIIPGVDGAISNYAITLRHMHQNYIDDAKPLSLSEDFDFNGYDITDNCFVVRDL